MRALIIIGVLALAAGRAEAYPQFQLSRDQTCTGCHLAPAGGGLLSENGITTAESISQLGTDPEFMYGAIDTPEWLTLGGDIRAQGGYLQAPQRFLWAFPMQGEVYAAAGKDNFSVRVTAGMRPAQSGNEALTRVWAREHYVMWQSEPGAAEGMFLRAGHFMPVFGLRWVEHPLYVRRYGGTPLFSETYAASASYVKLGYEAHVTGFVKNPLMDGVRQNRGGAAYAELRVADKTLVGAGAMGEFSDWDFTLRGEVTFKHYLPSPDLLLQAELQLINPHVEGYGHRELAAYVMGTYFAPMGVMIDVGFGHYDKNLRIPQVDRDCFDLNIHWFTTSHFEAMIVSRFELMQWGSGGPTGAYAMLQGHYRL